MNRDELIATAERICALCAEHAELSAQLAAEMDAQRDRIMRRAAELHEEAAALRHAIDIATTQEQKP